MHLRFSSGGSPTALVCRCVHGLWIEVPHDYCIVVRRKQRRLDPEHTSSIGAAAVAVKMSTAVKRTEKTHPTWHSRVRQRRAGAEGVSSVGVVEERGVSSNDRHH